MITKINLDGAEHMAIVFGKAKTVEDIIFLRRALVNYMENVESGANISELNLEDVRYYLLDLLSELELTDAQTAALINYFGNVGAGTPEKKTCEIFI